MRLPENTVRPKRKISIDSMFDSEPETSRPYSISDRKEEQSLRDFYRSNTAESMTDVIRSDSAVSLENVNLNASFNLGSFTSVGSNVGPI